MADGIPEATQEQRDAAFEWLKAKGHAVPYIFIRAEMFYPIELRDDADAVANALCNPGTLRVENGITGRTVWQAPQAG
jgi:hypothetical protein